MSTSNANVLYCFSNILNVISMDTEEGLGVSDDVLSCLLDNFESSEVSQLSDSQSDTADLSADSVELYAIKIQGKKKNTFVVVSGTDDRIVENRYIRNKDRKRKRAKLEKVEVVRVDIRNTFALMMANVYNTMDFNQISGMLKTYSTPDAAFCMDRTKGDKFSVNFNGPLMMANALYSNLSIYPDCVTTLLSSGYDASTGIVSYTLQFTMTKVFNYQTILTVLPNMCVESTTTATATATDSSSTQSSLGSDSSDSSDSIDSLTNTLSEAKIVEKVSDLRESLPLRSKPVVVVVQAKVVLRTNEQKRIVEGKTTLITIKND